MTGSGMTRPGTATIAGICAAAAAALVAFLNPSPAAAQVAGVIPPDHVFEGDYVIVGVGAMAIPSYQGSDDSQIMPAIGAMGEVGGIGFTLRGPSLSLDLVPDRPGQDVRLRFGPQVRLRGNRTGRIGDPVVARLGKLDNVVEAGLRVGVSLDDVLSPADGLAAGISARWDISGKGSGMVVTPSATYLLPVSRAQAFGLLVSAQFVDDRYADYNYSISPAGAQASGLPVYRARGGFQEASVGLATARDLSGDFLDGGLSIGAGVMYSRLFGSAARSPITSIRGSRDQWMFGAGLGYTF